jgi:HEAT repeat protein
MSHSQKIKFLLEDHDLDGLVKILRNSGDPVLRAEAAGALGELDDMEAVEALIRTALQDPDPAVQKAARSSLDLLLGSQADLAISTYCSGPPDRDAWLHVSEAASSIQPSAMGQSANGLDLKVRYLLSQGDLFGLVSLLRTKQGSGLRAQAAEALGKLGDLEATEFLVRAHLEDPDGEVRQAARQALHGLIGTQTGLAIASYRSTSHEPDEWLQDLSLDVAEEEEVDDETEWEEVDEKGEPDEASEDAPDLSDLVPPHDPVQARWDDENLDGLMAVLSHEIDPEMRLRAIQALRRSSDMRAISALAQTSLAGDDKRVREAARSILQERFGDDAEDIIESYRDELKLEDLDEDEESDGDEADETNSDQDYPGPLSTQSSSAYSDHAPVIQEGGLPWGLIGLVGLGILVILGVLFFLLTR